MRRVNTLKKNGEMMNEHEFLSRRERIYISSSCGFRSNKIFIRFLSQLFLKLQI